MQWKYEVIQDLKELEHKRAALVLIPQELDALNAHITSARASSTDAIRVDGGDDHRTEDALLDAIVKKDKLAAQYDFVRAQVETMDAAIEGLSPDLRDIIEMSFIHRHTIDDIGDKYHIERSQVYRLRDKALRILALRKYGLVDA